MARLEGERLARYMADEAEAVAMERADPLYAEAEAYVRSMGHQGFVYVGRLLDRLEAGNMLTIEQVEQVQRSRKADIRATALAYRAEKRRQEKVGSQVDLSKVYIGPNVTDGDYAVMAGRALAHISVVRPAVGTFRGFVVVTVSLGEGVVKTGFQHPQPYREVPGYRQWYRGDMGHLVAEVAANPAAARERYEEAA